MNEKDLTRKLAAIRSADLREYRRLMYDDEVDTVRIITAYRGLMIEEVRAHSGRVVAPRGDNPLSQW